MSDELVALRAEVERLKAEVVSLEEIADIAQAELRSGSVYLRLDQLAAENAALKTQLAALVEELRDTETACVEAGADAMHLAARGEREACAQVAEGLPALVGCDGGITRILADDIAKAIRARGGQ